MCELSQLCNITFQKKQLEARLTAVVQLSEPQLWWCNMPESHIWRWSRHFSTRSSVFRHFSDVKLLPKQRLLPFWMYYDVRPRLLTMAVPAETPGRCCSHAEKTPDSTTSRVNRFCSGSIAVTAPESVEISWLDRGPSVTHNFSLG